MDNEYDDVVTTAEKYMFYDRAIRVLQEDGYYIAAGMIIGCAQAHENTLTKCVAHVEISNGVER